MQAYFQESMVHWLDIRVNQPSCTIFLNFYLVSTPYNCSWHFFKWEGHSLVPSWQVDSFPFLSVVFIQAYSSPKDDPDLGVEEKRLILEGSVSKAPVSDIPWKLILSKAPVWALIISHFCHNWGTFILLTWMPTYYNQVINILNISKCFIQYKSLTPLSIVACI